MMTLETRAKALKLKGLLDHWADVFEAPWVKQLIEWEENSRSQHSVQRRLNSAKLGQFKPLAYFDWAWPKSCDRLLIEDLMGTAFIKENMNIVICGPNGVGKTTIAKNLAYAAIMTGSSALFVNAATLLNELAAISHDHGRFYRRLKHYTSVGVLVIDEIGYLSYASTQADLLFQVISGRYQKKPTIITTNKPFAEWPEVFPHAACVVSMVDRLLHQAELVQIDAASFRSKESSECKQARQALRIQKQREKQDKGSQSKVKKSQLEREDNEPF